MQEALNDLQRRLHALHEEFGVEVIELSGDEQD
jgi:hypothetical protein